MCCIYPFVVPSSCPRIQIKLLDWCDSALTVFPLFLLCPVHSILKVSFNDLSSNGKPSSDLKTFQRFSFAY